MIQTAGVEANPGPLSLGSLCCLEMLDWPRILRRRASGDSPTASGGARAHAAEAELDRSGGVWRHEGPDWFRTTILNNTDV